jgi:hypothetical protein
MCQRHEIIFLTASRNDEGPESLKAAVRAMNDPWSLPVLTIADLELVLNAVVNR